ncbi:MAG TPA: TAT-variant-translocated molybdopterin oxidoreductase [Candidatus Acidoferrales bacterium]|nr:TAT-variant-translocated molybdopterin oxidoreductase [Candidatus Acidoferrales bacterium]
MNQDTNSKIAPLRAVDLSVAQARSAEPGGKRFWQSIQELSDTEEFRDFLENEFPANSDKKDWKGIDRRELLKLMAASTALAGLSACTKLPTEKIVPYVKPPEEIIPGRPLFYATSMPQPGGATGLLVESNMGRPTKIEGNPEHPGSLGSTDIFAQASILDMYDPDRSQTEIFDGEISTYEAFAAAMSNARAQFATGGAGVRILTETVTSPSLAGQIRAFLAQYPQAKWHQFQACSGDNVREATQVAFGKQLNPIYHLDRADVVVSLDADFLTAGPAHVRNAREFASRRDMANGPSSNLNRLYVVEGMPTNTGVVSDHRLSIRPSEVEAFARQLAAAVGVSGVSAGAAPAGKAGAWIGPLAKDLAAHHGASLVIAGEHQPAAVHALAYAMNAALGNIGKTIEFTEPLEPNPVNELESLRDLVNDLNAGKVSFLLILGSNPVYDAPADFEFASALAKARLRVHVGLYHDETAELCHWHAPAAHYLESWSDTRAYEGTAGIVQPLILPLYDGHSAHEIIALFSDDAGKSGHDIVRDYWQSQHLEKGQPFEAFWERSLHDGIISGTAFPAVAATLRPDFTHPASAQSNSSAPGALDIAFYPDPTVGDGHYSNNAWLQELPKPVTRTAWDNAALVSAATAQKLGVNQNDYVTLQLNGRKLDAGIYVVPGHAPDLITLHLGYGRTRAGNVGNGCGFNANLIRTSNALWMAGGLQVAKTGKTYSFASTQHQYTMDLDGHPVDEESVAAIDHRGLVQIATIEEFKKDPAFAQASDGSNPAPGLSIYPGFKSDGYAWGMAIDLNRCVGCNACVIACQSENNIAVVGKDQVERGRVMHWIRIDTYFNGPLDDPKMYYEPLPCMQCENAPCEYVCPVGATTHSIEGLNEMTYNRCVGTRYCSNNCPYKVRRFNFYLYSDWNTPSLYGMRNPNVSVRSRGVMEKCTYCVQRINEAKIRSEEENRTVRDGEIITACMGVCPAEAIVFGNINDPNSRVSKLKAQSRNYGLLEDLNTRPRTTYLARITNPNSEMPA